MAKRKPGTLSWLCGEPAAENPPSPPQYRQAGPAPPSDAELLDAYSRAVTAVVERIGPAVVSIHVDEGRRSSEFEPAGAGSGFVITPDGYILTNTHVVANARDLRALFIDGHKLLD